MLGQRETIGGMGTSGRVDSCARDPVWEHVSTSSYSFGSSCTWAQRDRCSFKMVFSSYKQQRIIYFHGKGFTPHQQFRASLDVKACPQVEEELRSFCESMRTLALLVEEQAPEGPPK